MKPMRKFFQFVAISLSVAAGAYAAAVQTAKHSAPISTDVTYFDKKSVDEGFAKGSTIFDTDHGRNYTVITGRRDKPGESEIHAKDTDVIYVVEGTATIITGGEATDAKATAPDELRGVSIRGGQTRKIAKGEVLVIPNNVPHQFTEMTQPFLYLVVKVR